MCWPSRSQAALYLVVRPGGSKQWMFLYRRDGKLKEMGLGSPLKGITLAMARGLRDEARGVMARGADPLEVRRQSKQESQAFRHSAPMRSPSLSASKRGFQIPSIASNGATRSKPTAGRSGIRRLIALTRWVCWPV